MESTVKNPDSILFDGGKRCNIFVVDYGDHMFKNPKGVDFKTALKGVRERINDLCCSGDVNEVGVVAFINTANTNRDAQNIDCIYVHHAFGTFDAEYVKQLDGLLASENIRSEAEKILGECGTCNWAELFFLCQRIFTYSGSVIRRKAVIIFTRDHDPCDGDEDVMKTIKQRISDLRGDTRTNVPAMEGVQFGLFLIGTDEGDDISNFWTQVGLDAAIIPVEDMENEVKRKNYSIRAISALPLKLAEGVEFAVGVYPLIQEQRKPTAQWLDAATNERLESKSHFVEGGNDYEAEADEEELTEREHYEGEVRYAVKLGKAAKPFCVLTREDKEQLRRLDPPGITIIGFKSMDQLKDSHRTGQSRFIFPLENAISGSISLYRALHEKCVQRNMFILVRYTQMRNTSPVLAALIPQSRENKEDVHRYEGFHLVELPFQEEKRELQKQLEPPRGWAGASAGQVDAAKKFIGRLTGPYTPDQFSNPALQRYYNGLEAIALDKDFDTFINEAQKSDKIQAYFDDPEKAKRAGAQLAEFQKLVEESEQSTSSKSKAKAPRGKKVAAKEESDEEEEDVKPAKKRGRK